MRIPTIGLTSDTMLIRDMAPGVGVYEYYVHAIIAGAGGLPWIIPAFGARLNLDALVERIDGLVLSGAVSNIEPHRYHGTPSDADSPSDPARDATTLPLIPMVLARGIPLFGICRGFQELNVALGGTLHQQVHDVPGYKAHHADPEASFAQKFAPAHTVEVRPGGLLAEIVGTGSYEVNSVHYQGVARLGEGLRVEAAAPDGLIEAVSVVEARGYALAVQWHPEWEFEDNALYRSLWSAFGAACREYAERRPDRHAN